MTKQTVTLIPGDGIGPEVAAAATRVIDAAGAEIEWEPHVAGAKAIEQFKDPLPDHVLESIRRNGVALKGPVETKVGGGVAGRGERTREAHAQGDIGLQHLLDEQLASFAQPSRVVGGERVGDHLFEALPSRQRLRIDPAARQVVLGTVLHAVSPPRKEGILGQPPSEGVLFEASPQWMFA
jgi:hypothetical protein